MPHGDCYTDLLRDPIRANLSETGEGVIRGILFDFGNVISSFDMGNFIGRMREWSGVPTETLRDRIYGSDLPVRYERGEITSEVFYRSISHLAGAQVSADEFAEAFSGIFTPIEPTHALIRSLKGKYRLGLLSNTNELHFEYHIRNVPVFPLFDSVTLSFEVGALKPDPEIFRDALDKIALPPEAVAFIDDVRENAEAASALGMRGIRYTGHAELLEALAKIGVVSFKGSGGWWSGGIRSSMTLSQQSYHLVQACRFPLFLRLLQQYTLSSSQPLCAIHQPTKNHS